MSTIDRVYQARISELTPLDRVARSVAMLHWSRELIARQVLASFGPLSKERVKWEVAMRMYGADSRARKLIQRQLDRVPN